MRRAQASDVPMIAATLGQMPHMAMFPLSHLINEGFEGTDARRMTFWLGKGDRPDILAVTNAGMVLPVLPGGALPGAVAALSGHVISGIIGPTDQVRGLQRLLALDDAATTLDVDEPHFLLTLDDLVVPHGPGTLVPLADAPRQRVLDWMEAYQLEALNTPATLARDRAVKGYENGMAQNNRRVLMQGDVPLAMTAFNAQLPDVVQIGGVYTPPGLRGRGHGRRVVALHLAQAHAAGVTQATLSAATATAERAYTAIGFQRIGRWSFVMFERPQIHD